MSNVIELDITARDERVDDQVTDDALRVLDGRSTEEAKIAAALTVRDLGSPRAIDEMARRARRGSSGAWAFEAGLFGVRDRDRVLSAMERQLDEPGPIDARSRRIARYAPRLRRPLPRLVRRPRHAVPDGRGAAQPSRDGAPPHDPPMT